MSDEPTTQKIDDGGPAFPNYPVMLGPGGQPTAIPRYKASGMSTRTWLAGMAMQGLLSRDDIDLDAEQIASDSILHADITLAQLSKDSPNA